MEEGRGRNMSIKKVRTYFREQGIEDRIMEFDVSSATVDLAAEAVGVEGARICKTLSFEDKDAEENGCILIQAAGDAKINNGKFKREFGFKPTMLKPDQVLARTGHAVGGVCAFGIDNPAVKIYCDTSLKRFASVFPACGSDNSAAEFTPEELFHYSHALKWVDVSKIPEV